MKIIKETLGSTGTYPIIAAGGGVRLMPVPPVKPAIVLTKKESSTK